MAIGPVQLIVLGFEKPDFHGEIIEELERLRESDTVRVIDALAVHKDAAGDIEVLHLSNLTRDEAVELGSKIGALIGLGIEGEEGIEEGAIAGAQAAADGISVFDEDDAWDVIEEIPNDSAAALLLIEHHWAVPLRNAIARAGGFRISDGFISPLDLIAHRPGHAPRRPPSCTPSRPARRPNDARPPPPQGRLTMMGGTPGRTAHLASHRAPQVMTEPRLRAPRGRAAHSRHADSVPRGPSATLAAGPLRRRGARHRRTGPPRTGRAERAPVSPPPAPGGGGRPAGGRSHGLAP